MDQLLQKMLYADHPKYYKRPDSLEFSSKGKAKALEVLKVIVTYCKDSSNAKDKELLYNSMEFVSKIDLGKFKNFKKAAETAARASVRERKAGKPKEPKTTKEPKVEIKCGCCGEFGGRASPPLIAKHPQVLGGDAYICDTCAKQHVDQAPRNTYLHSGVCNFPFWIQQ